MTETEQITEMEEQLERAKHLVLESQTKRALLKGELEDERLSATVAWTIIKILAVAGVIYAGLHWP